MARFVTVSVVGCAGLRVFDPDTGRANDLPNSMIDYLCSQMQQVVSQKPDLIVLPERCDIPADFLEGPALDPRLEDYHRASREPVMALMRDTAKQHGCYIAYPTLARDNNGMHNSIVLIGRDGEVVGRYDKTRPTLDELDKGVSPGPGAVVLDCDFGRVGLLICFDLNFDELRLAYKQLSPDLLVFSSVYHGGLMQEYWPYSCGCHMASAIGPTATPSEVRLPTGDVIARSSNHFNHATATINLDCAQVHLSCLIEKIDKIKNQYGTSVHIHDPGRSGVVVISAESNDLTIQQIMNEFDLELLDTYLERTRQGCLQATR